MSSLHDSAQHYGLVSRILHWGMAALLGWQFFTTLVHLLLAESSLDEFAWATHKPTGVLLMALVLVRLLWALANRSRRPASLNAMARLGHLALYALMLLVPLLALLRQYGSGRQFSVFGIELMAGFSGPKTEWLMAPANLLHGNLGWLLLALILGHAAMALVHRRQGEADVLGRMIGRAR